MKSDRDNNIVDITSQPTERENNIHVHQGVTEDEFVAMRAARDATLEMPVLIFPSVQVNMRAGSCEFHLVVGGAVDQQPIRLDVALAIARPIALGLQ